MKDEYRILFYYVFWKKSKQMALQFIDKNITCDTSSHKIILFVINGNDIKRNF